MKSNTPLEEKDNQIFQLALISCSTAFDVSEEQILTLKRGHPCITTARQMVYWIMRKATPTSLAQIGGMVNKDHGAVLHGIRAMDDVFNVGDIPDNPFYKTAHRAARMFKELNRELVVSRREKALEKARVMCQ
jgi:hypothetical protein